MLVVVSTVGAALTAAAAVVGASVSAIAAPADDTQPSAVEDGAYPGADQILRDRGITLISGDGHLQLTTCGLPGLVEVHADANQDHDRDPGHFCFKVSGPTGYLKLQIADAYQVMGDDHSVQATVTVKGQTSTVNVAKHGWTGIGVGAGPDPAMLVELKAAP
ncbi:hypothetical protein [Amycolatopsis sp. NPDC059657]|uniref:hypothetical protein n=1 Tax=Amycolatopsis sp. NPDC059657 TaxID=3346899 RepID=UPI00366BE0F8